MTASRTRSFLSAESFFFLQEAVAASAALAAAQRLGVLARLEAGPANVPTLAQECQIGERSSAMLLAALASLGLVEAGDDGTYRAAASGLSWLAALRDQWEELAEVIHHDQPVVAADTTAGAARLYPAIVRQLAAVLGTAGELAADRLAAPGLRILDVGAGAAPWSLALAARYTDCRITAVDVPETLAVTQAAVEAAGRDAQFHYLAGDFFTVDLGRAAYDLAIAGNVCHLFDERMNRRLLGRLCATLRPGGTVAILDALPNERLDGPRPVVLYGLGLLLRTTRGRVYPFSQYVAWLRSAGFEAIERVDLTGVPPVSLIVGQRPDAGTAMSGQHTSGYRQDSASLAMRRDFSSILFRSESNVPGSTG